MTDTPMILIQITHQNLHLPNRSFLAGLLVATAPSDIDRKHAHGVELRVSHDGGGFDSASIQPGLHGLNIIRQRACALGADLTVRSQPNQRAEIVVTWEERQ